MDYVILKYASFAYAKCENLKKKNCWRFKKWPAKVYQKYK
jgi:hypothetical protein